MTDYDSRLVELYDTDNPDGPDHDFYRSLADEVEAASILDLGCGTGMLTVTFVRSDRSVVGVDPSANMLAYARRRAGGKSVQWVPGDSRDLPGISFDLAVMTGNVAQHIPDPDWMRTLKDVRQRMGEGGVVAFESRNPAVRAWTTWTSQKPTTRTTSYGLLREWHEATEVSPGIVELTSHRFFENTNDHVAEKSLLVFRERSAIENQLASADFRVEAVYGDWHHSSFTVDAPLMVFVARAA